MALCAADPIEQAPVDVHLLEGRARLFEHPPGAPAVAAPGRAVDEHARGGQAGAGGERRGLVGREPHAHDADLAAGLGQEHGRQVGARRDAELEQPLPGIGVGRKIDPVAARHRGHGVQGRIEVHVTIEMVHRFRPGARAAEPSRAAAVAPAKVLVGLTEENLPHRQ